MSSKIFEVFAGKRVVVTGGLGYIGSHVTALALENDLDIICLDNLENSSKDVLDGIKKITGKEPIFIELDIREKKSLKNLFDEFNDITGVIREEKSLGGVAGDTETIKAQQDQFTKFQSSVAAAVGKELNNSNHTGHGLIQSAASGVNTGVMEKDLEKMNDGWKSLKHPLLTKNVSLTKDYCNLVNIERLSRDFFRGWRKWMT